MPRLRTLGRVDLRPADDEASVPALQPKQLALLAYLATRTDVTHRRDKLLPVFWPETDTHRARAALNQTLYELRQALGRESVLSHGNETLSVSGERIWCDADVFARHVAAGRLEDALRLYRGPFLDGFHLSGAAPFERWMDERRATLRAQAVDAALELERRAREEDDRGETETWLRRLLRLAPGDEEVARRLIRLLVRSGDRAGALRVYRSLVDHLRGKLELEPSPATRKLARTVTTGPDDRLSVAVLPFRELGASSSRPALGPGLSEEILNALARLRSVRVMGGHSSARVLERNGGAGHTARDLDVDALLEGSVRRDSDRIRVAARLVRTTDGTTLWSDTYEPALVPADIFETQEEIARRIAEALSVEVPPVAGEPLIRRPTADSEAYRAYLEGRHAWRRRSVESLRDALRHFRVSLDRDPGNALAWSGVADSRALLPIYGDVGREECLRQARNAAARALELDPTLAEARTSLARVYVERHRWEAAERELRRALTVNPSYAPARHWLADHLMRTGRNSEALEEVEDLVRLEPLSPFALAGRAFLLYLTRDYGGAVAAARCSRSFGDSAQATFLEALALAERGDDTEALSVADEGARRWPDAARGEGIRTYIRAMSGDGLRAGAPARELEDFSGEPFYAAMTLAARGAADDAFRRLQDTGWTSLEVDLFVSGPAFDPVRSDPRYRTTLRELGLPRDRAGG